MIFGKHINKYYFRYSWMFLIGLCALIFVDYCQLAIPEFYRMVVNGLKDGTVGGDTFDLNFVLDKICLPMIFIIIIMVAGRFVWRICFFGAGIKIEEDLRMRMFDKCKGLSWQYYQVNKVGNLMSLFTNDINTVYECMGAGVMMFFDAAFLGGLAIYKMWSMNPLLTVLSMIPMAFLVVVAALVGKFMTKKWRERQEVFSGLSDFSQESFSGIAVIKAFVKETFEAMAFKKLNKENERANISYTRISILLNIFMSLFIETTVAVILGYGGYLVINGRFDAGQLVEFIGYFMAMGWPVMAVSQLIEKSAKGKASLNRIGDLLDAETNVVDRDDVCELQGIKGDIEFRGLSFTYPDGDCNVLNDVSFKINHGENVGIVGKTGSGKTSVVDLILRVYNVDDGQLFIDGVDVNKIPIRQVRESAAYVPQDNFLFSDTIENNIAFASDDFDGDDVSAAARLSDIHNNIMGFAQGYKTVLGERGVTVSGGQKQRISIARALIKNAPILILDDSVSAVDTKTERAILDNLRQTRKNMTTILIAHRVTTVMSMDKIIFIDDGRILACGTHDELYATCPEYKTMVELQRLDDEKGGNA